MPETESQTPSSDPQGSDDPVNGVPNSLPKRIMAMTGYLMLIGTAGSIGWMSFQISIFSPTQRPDLESQLFAWFLENYTSHLVMLLGAFFLGFLGIRLLGAAGKGSPEVIPPEDRKLLEPLISAANHDAIREYVILASLAGFTGTFQKVGFSGLPLATVTLTLIFSALSFVEEEFLELAKLTLGAFIGSFVQKGVDTIRQSTND